jgi:hypothetical protein
MGGCGKVKMTRNFKSMLTKSNQSPGRLERFLATNPSKEEGRLAAVALTSPIQMAPEDYAPSGLTVFSSQCEAWPEKAIVRDGLTERFARGTGERTVFIGGCPLTLAARSRGCSAAREASPSGSLAAHFSTGRRLALVGERERCRPQPSRRRARQTHTRVAHGGESPASTHSYREDAVRDGSRSYRCSEEERSHMGGAWATVGRNPAAGPPRCHGLLAAAVIVGGPGSTPRMGDAERQVRQTYLSARDTAEARRTCLSRVGKRLERSTLGVLQARSCCRGVSCLVRGRPLGRSLAFISAFLAIILVLSLTERPPPLPPERNSL